MTYLKQTFLLMCALLLFSSNLLADIKYNITVAQDGSGDYTCIQEAINATKAFPDKRITIHIKDGIYHEKVIIYSWNNLLTLEGESADKTIIAYDDYFDKMDLGRNSTFHTYTLMVDADDCILRNLTIINSSGPVGQAVALHIEKDRCEVVDCRIKGFQDTVYTAGEGSRQFFLRCYIEGSVDFIFGAATVLFEDCELHNKTKGYVTAASTFNGTDFGYVFKNCKLTADPDVENVYLGRPWRKYAQTVFITCDLGKHIAVEGWKNWNEAEKTAFYAEYDCKGKGADTKQRVAWSKQLTKKQADRYTMENIFKDWSPEVK